MASLLPPALLGLALTLLLPGSAAATPQNNPPAPERPALTPTPDRLVRGELQALCRRFREGDGPFFGTAAVVQIEARKAQFEALPEARQDPGFAIQLYGSLAAQQVRLGRLDEAVASFEAAGRWSERPGVPEELRLQVLFDRALTSLLQAEAANCIAAHTSASCILPLLPAGVHGAPEAARRAGDLFAAYLEERPDAVQARWLLNIARLVSGDYPDGVPEALRPTAVDLLPQPRERAGGAPFPRFVDIAARLGVDAFDLSGGAVMDDFDGDGLLDLVSTTWDPCGPMKAFRNDGRGGFEPVAEAWGLDAQLGGLNLSHADFDGDGDLDLLVLRGAWMGQDGQVRSSLLRNDLATSGRFEDVTAAAGLSWPARPTQAAAWADYDLDGDLDLYLGNEAPGGNPAVAGASFRAGRGFPSQLYRNRGDGTFEDVAARAGVTNDRYAKGVAWGDIDGDGDPDLFVSNIGPNRLYRNDGDGTFTDVAAAAGVAERPATGFATWFFDADQDGHEDLFVADYSAPYERVSAALLGLEEGGAENAPSGAPVLYRNRGDGTFEDVSAAFGLTRPTLPMGSDFGDLDDDGWLDVYLGTGVPDPAALMPNVMLRNLRGEGFEEVTYAGGFGHLQKGHGVAFGDLDRDGDQDIFQQMGGAYPFDAYGNALYENPLRGNPSHESSLYSREERDAARGDGTSAAEPSRPRFLVLRFAGAGKNPFAVGARVEVRVRSEDGGLRSIHRTVGARSSFGGSSHQLEIGLGPAAGETVDSVVVRWPRIPTGRAPAAAGEPVAGAGTIQTFPGVAMDRAYRVVQGAEALEPLTYEPFTLGGGTGADAPAAAEGPHHHSGPPEP